MQARAIEQAKAKSAWLNVLAACDAGDDERGVASCVASRLYVADCASTWVLLERPTMERG